MPCSQDRRRKTLTASSSRENPSTSTAKKSSVTPRCAQLGQSHNRQQHAQRTVKAAGIAHRVEMRAKQQRFRFPRTNPSTGSGPARQSPMILPAASSRTPRPAVRIQPPTSAFARSIAGERNVRVSRSHSSLTRPNSSSQRASFPAAVVKDSPDFIRLAAPAIDCCKPTG